MEAQEMVVVGTIASGVADVEGPWLNQEGQARLSTLLDSQAPQLASLSLDAQKELLRLAMTNLGVFVALFERLDLLPGPLKYALISKGMYEMGLCGMPPELTEDVQVLMDAVQDSYWTNDETSDSAYNYREVIVKDASIGPLPLLDEFPNCGDTSLLLAILENPICPDSISQDILNRNHFIFEEYDEEDLEDLVEQAQLNLS
jgi:hypothetical protein